MRVVSYGRRGPRKSPSPAEPPPAVSELMRDHFEAKEFGVVGEFAVPQPQPPPIVTPALQFPAPDWDEEAREREARERAAEEEKAQKVLADKAKREEAQQ
jgi:hypothetical protein